MSNDLILQTSFATISPNMENGRTSLQIFETFDKSIIEEHDFDEFLNWCDFKFLSLSIGVAEALDDTVTNPSK